MKQFQRNGLLSVLIFDIMIYLRTELQAPVLTQNIFRASSVVGVGVEGNRVCVVGGGGEGALVGVGGDLLS